MTDKPLVGRNLAGGMVKLPEPRKDSKTSVESAFHLRRSVREFGKTELSLVEVSQLLWAAQGVTDPEGKRASVLLPRPARSIRWRSFLWRAARMSCPLASTGIGLRATNWIWRFKATSAQSWPLRHWRSRLLLISFICIGADIVHESTMSPRLSQRTRPHGSAPLDFPKKSAKIAANRTG